jgi:hypothetical protein
MDNMLKLRKERFPRSGQRQWSRVESLSMVGPFNDLMPIPLDQRRIQDIFKARFNNNTGVDACYETGLCSGWLNYAVYLVTRFYQR